jgi:hypothetical protein
VAVSVLVEVGTVATCSRAPPSDQDLKRYVTPSFTKVSAALSVAAKPITEVLENGAARSASPPYPIGAPAGELASVMFTVCGRISIDLVVWAPFESVAVRRIS